MPRLKLYKMQRLYIGSYAVPSNWPRHDGEYLRMKSMSSPRMEEDVLLHHAHPGRDL